MPFDAELRPFGLDVPFSGFAGLAFALLRAELSIAVRDRLPSDTHNRRDEVRVCLQTKISPAGRTERKIQVRHRSVIGRAACESICLNLRMNSQSLSCINEAHHPFGHCCCCR